MRPRTRIHEAWLSWAAAFGVACGAGPDDGEIARSVQRALSADADLQTDVIDVVSVNGTVTLTGSVDMPLDRDRAEDIARGVDGVKAVNNRLEVIATAMPPAETAPPPLLPEPPQREGSAADEAGTAPRRLTTPQGTEPVSASD
jgi:hypothetical protein